MALILGVIGFLVVAIIGIGLLGTVLLVVGAVAFLESGSILGLIIAIIGLLIICAVD